MILVRYRDRLLMYMLSILNALRSRIRLSKLRITIRDATERRSASVVSAGPAGGIYHQHSKEGETCFQIYHRMLLISSLLSALRSNFPRHGSPTTALNTLRSLDPYHKRLMTTRDQFKQVSAMIAI
jgi:hypothetical protein